MKIDGRLFLWGCGFYALVAVIYWYFSVDWAGVTALAFTAFMAFLVGFYLTFTARRVGPQPEDDLDGDSEDADPDYGFFSPHSWWPMAVAGSAAIVGVGLVFAAWLVLLGVVSLMLSLVGFVFEYYRGDFSH